MVTKLHLGSGNYLYYESGQAVEFNGYPVKKWDGSNNRWSLSTGSEIKEFKGKTIFDLEKVLGLNFFENLEKHKCFSFFVLNFCIYLK